MEKLSYFHLVGEELGQRVKELFVDYSQIAVYKQEEGMLSGGIKTASVSICADLLRFQMNTCESDQTCIGAES
jgi:hypothetical protein